MGYYFEPEDTDQLLDVIKLFLDDPRKIKGFKERAIELTEELGSADKVYGRLVAFLEQVRVN